ncbi:Short transient receptor putative channel 3 [Biomphalaria glabrata]|nr:short transient receptor potential channel 3-like isoform X8 [Biomphalaria glabrata]
MHRLVKRYLFKLERAKDEKEIAKDAHGNVRAEEVEIWDPTIPDGPPPPVPETPSRIPFATPPIPEEEEDYKSHYRSTRRKGGSRPYNRRSSASNLPIATTLAIPQLDAIQRSQKLLDMRLQQLQANHKETNRLQDDVEFIRRLMAENQKALCNVVQALANIQGEIVNLVQCLKPQPKTKPANSISSQGSAPNAHHQTNAISLVPAGGVVILDRDVEGGVGSVSGGRRMGDRERGGSGDRGGARRERNDSRKRSGPDDDESKV